MLVVPGSRPQSFQFLHSPVLMLGSHISWALHSALFEQTWHACLEETDSILVDNAACSFHVSEAERGGPGVKCGNYLNGRRDAYREQAGDVVSAAATNRMRDLCLCSCHPQTKTVKRLHKARPHMSAAHSSLTNLVNTGN